MVEYRELPIDPAHPDNAVSFGGQEEPDLGKGCISEIGHMLFTQKTPG